MSDEQVDTERGAEAPACAQLTCPCGCGNVVRTWHGPNCPDDCDI